MTDETPEARSRADHTNICHLSRRQKFILWFHSFKNEDARIIRSIVTDQMDEERMVLLRDILDKRIYSIPPSIIEVLASLFPVADLNKTGAAAKEVTLLIDYHLYKRRF